MLSRKILLPLLGSAACFSWCGEGLARPPQNPPKGELVLRLDGLAQFNATEQDVVGGGSGTGSDFSTTIGPKLGLNIGFAFSPTFRFGLYGTAMGSPVISGGDGFPSVSLDASFRWTVGPMATLRLGRHSPFELEAGIGFSHQIFVGSTSESTQPGDAGYKMGADFFGGEGTVHGIWRPGGAGSLFGIMAGASFGWLKSSGTSNEATASLIGPEAGISLGF